MFPFFNFLLSIIPFCYFGTKVCIEGSEDENIVLAEIGGDESDDNVDEIGGYESDDGIVHFKTRSGRQATRLNLYKL